MSFCCGIRSVVPVADTDNPFIKAVDRRGLGRAPRDGPHDSLYHRSLRLASAVYFADVPGPHVPRSGPGGGAHSSIALDLRRHWIGPNSTMRMPLTPALGR
jgi:hypothetical protein